MQDGSEKYVALTTRYYLGFNPPNPLNQPFKWPYSVIQFHVLGNPRYLLLASGSDSFPRDIKELKRTLRQRVHAIEIFIQNKKNQSYCRPDLVLHSTSSTAFPRFHGHVSTQYVEVLWSLNCIRADQSCWEEFQRSKNNIQNSLQRQWNVILSKRLKINLHY